MRFKCNVTYGTRADTGDKLTEKKEIGFFFATSSTSNYHEL